MNSLEKIQKVTGVFKIFARVAAILSMVGAGLALIFAIVFLVYKDASSISVFGMVLAEIGSGTGLEASGILFGEFIMCLTDGILFFCAVKYLNNEIKAGTPFTTEGAVQIKALGIKTIVLPLVAVILVEVVYGIFNELSAKLGEVSVELVRPDFNTGSSILLGVILIILSLIFSYGAELENKKA